MEKLKEILDSINNKWKELTRWKRALLTSFLAMFMGLAYYFLQVSPLENTLELKRKKLTELHLTVNRLKLAKRKKKELEDQILSLKEKIAYLERKLPTESEEIADIVKAIAFDEGNRLKITYLRRLTPEVSMREAEKRKEKKQKKRRSKTKTKKEGSSVNSYYKPIVYEVGIKTDYPTFVHWSESIAQAERIILINDIYLRNNQDSDKDSYTVVGDVIIKSFMLKR